MMSLEMILSAAKYIESPKYIEAQKRKKPAPKKVSRKRHASSDTWTFEKIKALSAKALVDRFSELVPDEINKKYYFHCRLRPGCTQTEWSFGSEEKAYNRMKIHLKGHLSEQSSEFDIRVFSKSPPTEEISEWSNSAKKPSKVPVNAKFVSETESSSDNDSQVLSEIFKAKKILEYSFESGSTAKRKQYIPKHKSVQHNGWSLPAISPIPSLPYIPELEDDDAWSPVEEKKHVDSYKLDHDYANMSPYPLSSRMMNLQRPEVTVPLKKKPTIQKQFIIKTPKFPYLHDMEEYVVAEIVELDCDGSIVRRRQRTEVNCLDIKNYLKSKFKEERSSAVTPSIYEMLSISETQDVTGSVLECVENKVGKKYTSACTPKISYSSSDNDENQDNVKKVKREQAMKHINHLTSKRKKQNLGPLLCQLCDDGRVFTAVASLMHHYRSHAGIKLYVCDVCQDTFTRQHSLNYHKMIHENRSRFQCEICPKKFRHPSHFREHMRRHTGETPFQCSICDMLFKTRNTYKRHLIVQHNKILTAHGIIDNTEDKAQSSKKSKKSSK